MSYGKMAVDWQQRLDFDKLRTDRINRANEMMKKHGVGAMLLFGWDNQRYVSSIFNHPYGRHLPAHGDLLVRGGGFPYVPTPSIDRRLKEWCPWMEGRLVDDDVLSMLTPYYSYPRDFALKGWAKTAEQIKTLMKQHGVADLPLGIDWTNPFVVLAFEKAGITIEDANRVMGDARIIKFDAEVELMKQAAVCQEAAFAAVAAAVRPGMRENDCQAIAAKAIYEAGAEYIEGWVFNSGERGAPRSFNWSDKAIRPGDFLNLEFCHTTFCGYKLCYDRALLVGNEPTELQREIYQVVVDMNHKLQRIIKPGITTHDIARSRPTPSDATTIKEIRKWRTSWSNHFGGMGIGWNEPPYLNLNLPEVTIEKNMCFAYHAGFVVEGVAGVFIENTYRVTDTGFEILTKWPYEKIMVCGTPRMV